MALTSAANIIRSLSALHLTLAYYFLTSPSTISEQSLVMVLGGSMGIPHSPTSFSTRSAPSTFLSLVLILSAISDLTAASMNEEIANHYWSSQAPIRLIFFFVVAGWSFVGKPGGPSRQAGLGRRMGMAMGVGEGEGLSNNLIFTWAFVELMMWFWIYTTLREERRELMAKRAEKKQVEEEDMLQ